MDKSLDFGLPLFKTKAAGHQSNKSKIVECIESGTKYGIDSSNIKLSSCDWHVIGAKKEYWEYSQCDIQSHVEEVARSLNFSEWSINDYWYQYYRTNDFHDWHVHGNCMFVGVYYVKLSADHPKILFSWEGKEYASPVEEGDIITFPSFLHHRAPKNETEDSKLIISFNVNFNIGVYE
tara:strand:+ start:539 stop:1072 length:534 start_codon:yes stop_codon:yes gene_type:complete